jgi:hypothetical protein
MIGQLDREYDELESGVSQALADCHALGIDPKTSSHPDAQRYRRARSELREMRIELSSRDRESQR